MGAQLHSEKLLCCIWFYLGRISALSSSRSVDFSLKQMRCLCMISVLVSNPLSYSSPCSSSALSSSSHCVSCSRRRNEKGLGGSALSFKCF